MLSRRGFLSGLLVVAAGRPAPAAAAVESRRSTYEVDLGLLYDLLRFHLTGTIAERVDRGRGRYEVSMRGEGGAIRNESESVGILRGGRWAPRRSSFRVAVYGRESELDVTYDHEARTVHYRGRSETFLLRRQRVVDDRVSVPEGMHVDDVASALLNHADGRWPPRPDDRFETHVVRRRRAANEGVDDAEPHYTAELVPLVLTLEPDPRSTTATASFDLGGLSPWARADHPARIVFGPDRRPRTVTSSLILGSSLKVALGV
jgi:hypothetical protein